MTTLNDKLFLAFIILVLATFLALCWLVYTDWSWWSTVLHEL